MKIKSEKVGYHILHNGHVYNISRGAYGQFGVLKIWEDEALYEKLRKDPTYYMSMPMSEKWRSLTSKEEADVKPFFETEYIDYDVEFKNNDKGCEEYSRAVEFPFVRSILSKMDYSNLSYELIDCATGKKEIYPMGEFDSWTPVTNVTPLSFCWSIDLVSEKGKTMLKTNYGTSYSSDYIHIKEAGKTHKTLRFEVIDEERFNIYGITQKITSKPEKAKIVVSNVLNWVASYSWKDGVTAKKLYGNGRTKDVSFVDLVTEISSLGNYASFDEEGQWIDSQNGYQFILDHRVFFEKVGFLDFLKTQQLNQNTKVQAILVKYMTLLGEFPVFEQVIKAGHGNIVAAIMKNASGNREIVKEEIRRWEDILNMDTTSGAKALKIPKYVSSYLASVNADVKDYLFWIKNWETFNFSKEQFEEFVGDPEYAIFKAEDIFAKSPFVKLVKEDGYNPQKLKKYAFAQATPSTSLYLLRDYVDMCESVGIKPVPYPYQLCKMHDDVVDIVRNVSKTYDEAYVKRIQSESRDIVAKTRQILEAKVRFPADFKDYVVLFPTAKQEFFNEGNAMHSCVGPYMRNVNNGNNIVFFIRKKEDPTLSYVTAEWDKNAKGVGQVLMSNNRECSDTKALAFAKWVANTIQSGVDGNLINL